MTGFAATGTTTRLYEFTVWKLGFSSLNLCGVETGRLLSVGTVFSLIIVYLYTSNVRFIYAESIVQKTLLLLPLLLIIVDFE